MSDRPNQLAHLDFLGDATKFSGHIDALIPKSNLLEHFSQAEVRLLSHCMDVFEQPMLGAKILMEFVLMLSQRLRATCTRLIEELDGRMQQGTV